MLFLILFILYLNFCLLNFFKKRAPELLLRKNMYSFEIDIWSFGCLLAEIALGETLFNGDTEIEQLFKVFKLIGSPNASNWSFLTDSQDFKATFPNWKPINLCKLINP